MLKGYSALLHWHKGPASDVKVRGDATNRRLIGALPILVTSGIREAGLTGPRAIYLRTMRFAFYLGAAPKLASLSLLSIMIRPSGIKAAIHHWLSL